MWFDLILNCDLASYGVFESQLSILASYGVFESQLSILGI